MAKCVTILGGMLLALAVPARAQQPGTIVGTVRNADAAASGARVSLRGMLAFEATTDSAGRFVLREVPPGDYVVVATLEGSNAGTAPALVRGGDTVAVAIALGGSVEISGITVTAEKGDEYRADSATGGTKFPVSLLDVPQDITVVTQAVIQDRHITDPRELTRNVAGVVALPTYGGSLNGADFLFRGMRSDAFNTSLHDGFRSIGQVTPIDMSSVDHVEFLMGPESVLYGAVGTLGGLANYISKQPLAERAAAMTLSGDAHGDVRTTLDLGGPISMSGQVRYRLNLSAEQVRGFRDYTAGSYAFSVAPVVAWLPNPRTSITFTGSYTQRQYRGDPGLPRYSGVFALPVSRFYGEPQAPPAFAESPTAQLVVTYRASPGIQLREGLGYTHTHQRDYNYGFLGVDSLGTSLLRVYGRSADTTSNATSQTELLANFMTGRLRNHAVAGLELSGGRYGGGYTNGDSLAPINLNHPVYGAVPSDTGAMWPWWERANQVGIYAQDLLDLADEWKVAAGARFDFNQTDHVGVGPADNLVLHQDTRHVSPSLGLVFQPSRRTSLYGSWANSFLPNLGCRTCGDPETWAPQLGQQFEVGVKQLFAHGRFAATLSAYQLTKQNVMLGDPTDPLNQRVVLVGRMQSRGVELDASGSPAPNLGLVVAYSYTNAKVIQGNVFFPVGTMQDNQPRNRLSLWSTYSVRHGAASGVEFGAGVTAADRQFANWGEPLRLPGYAIFDALLAYEGQAFAVQLNATNVTDVRSYQGGSYDYLYPGASRSAVATVEYRF
jgi:iron complex outermembrane receptor protein